MTSLQLTKKKRKKKYHKIIIIKNYLKKKKPPAGFKLAKPVLVVYLAAADSGGLI